jgi:exopolysaccharide biosynthesis protein
MNSLKILSLLLVLSVASFAQGIQKGAKVQVPPNSIWFQDDAKLAKWQKLKAGGNPDALTAYQQKELKKRNAWQFDKPLTVKILRYDQKRHIVQVKMETFGTMQGTKWYLDDSAFTQ